MLIKIKAPQFYTDLGLKKTVMNPPANGKIQGLFKTFECFSSTFQNKFYFQGLFKTILYIQILFKPVQTLDQPRYQLSLIRVFAHCMKKVWVLSHPLSTH